MLACLLGRHPGVKCNCFVAQRGHRSELRLGRLDQPVKLLPHRSGIRVMAGDGLAIHGVAQKRRGKARMPTFIGMTGEGAVHMSTSSAGWYCDFANRGLGQRSSHGARLGGKLCSGEAMQHAARSPSPSALRAFDLSRAAGEVYFTVISTCTSMPRKSFVLPVNEPDNGIACFGSRVTATRIRLRPPTRALVGSNSTHPAPGR